MYNLNTSPNQALAAAPGTVLRCEQSRTHVRHDERGGDG